MIHPDGPYQNLLENLESVSTDIRSGRGLAGYLLLDQRPVDYMDSLLAETDKAMKQINTLLAEATLRAKDIGPMMDEVTQLVAELNTFVKQLEALRMELSPAVDNVIEITDEVKRATKDLNKLRAKSEQTISLGNELLQRLKQTWPFVRRDGQGPPEEYPLP
jgi:ABC-type transporter Mla subunit MlaD